MLAGHAGNDRKDIVGVGRRADLACQPVEKPESFVARAQRIFRDCPFGDVDALDKDARGRAVICRQRLVDEIQKPLLQLPAQRV